MRRISTIARVLLGLIFTIFGLNGFLHFIPMAALPAGAAGDFMSALFQSHYLVVVFLLQLIAGMMLLTNSYVPLALVLIGPVIMNILLFHLFMAPGGLPLAVLNVILWTLAALQFRRTFGGLFRYHAEA